MYRCVEQREVVIKIHLVWMLKVSFGRSYPVILFQQSPRVDKVQLQGFVAVIQ